MLYNDLLNKRVYFNFNRMAVVKSGASTCLTFNEDIVKLRRANKLYEIYKGTNLESDLRNDQLINIKC